VYDIDGAKYLDFVCGIAVTNTGHCHPKVVKAIQDQAAKGIHMQVNVGMHVPMIDLTKRILDVLPKDKFDRVFFTNSGAEGIENAIKLARSFNRRTKVVAFRGGYHGRTIGTMAITSSKTVYHVGFGPFMPGAVIAPYPYCHRCGVKQAMSETERSAIECCGRYERDLDELFKTEVDASDVSAFIIEPILGEGGYTVPPKGFMQALRKICDEKNILLIADEVQSGFCRTGKYFAFEHFGVVPDIVVMAKGLASGMPLAAVASRSELALKQIPGSMGGTYAGNVISCAAGIATLDVFKEEKTLDNVNARSAEFFAGLREIQKDPKYNIADVRGIGLMVGLEFDDAKVAKGTASKVTQAAIANGLLLMTTGPYETIRFMPPLNVTQQQIKDGLALFKKALDVSL
jgi:4-aminobutyrate aminotransferase